jgi:hypothetical protein
MKIKEGIYFCAMATTALIFINALLLVGAVWLVVKVLRWMGVI